MTIKTVRRLDQDRQPADDRVRSHPLVALMVTAVLALGLLAGCTSDGGDETTDTTGAETPEESAPEPERPTETTDTTQPEPPEESAPEPETPEESAPAPDTPDEGGDAEEGLSDEDWLLLAILGVAGFAVIMLVASLSNQHSARKASARQVKNRRLAEIVGTGRWIHDQGSVDVMRATDGEQLRTLWVGTRERIMESERTVAVLAAEESDETLALSLDELSRALVGLRGAAETYVSLKVDPPADSPEALVGTATQTLFDRRQQLELALRPVEAARR